MPYAFQPRLIAMLLAGVFALAPLRGQKVEWVPDEGQLPVDMISELQLVFSNCEPRQQPVLPSTPGLNLQFRGRSQQINSVNFSFSKKVIYTYAAQLERKQAVRIPSFEIETDKGRLRVAEARFEPGEGKVGTYQVPVSKIAGSKLIPSSANVWAGEVFDLTYQLHVNTDYRAELASNPDWSPEPVIIEEWGKGRKLPQQGTNDSYVHIAYQTRGYLREPGQFELKPVTQLLNIQTNAGSGPFGFFPQMEQLAITSDKPRIAVRPLPLPAPNGFSGAVGRFKLESRIVPENAGVGEPITWTLTLTGTGNWPDFAGLPAREVSKAFQVIQPQSKRTMAEGKLFTGTLSEDVVLMPTQPGSYTLGEVRLVVFDTLSGTYQTLSTPRTTLTIAAVPAPGQTAPVTPSPAQPAGVEPSLPQTAGQQLGTTSAPPPPPAAIPGDPLPPASPTAAPFAPATHWTLLGLPFVGVFIYWLMLAWLRARQLDPLAPRRAAHARLQATLEQLSRLARIDAAQLATGSNSVSASSASTARQRLLSAWQHDTARLWNLSSAAPAAQAFLKSPAIPGSISEKSSVCPSPAAAATATLWQEADIVLYGASQSLPADWIDRALHCWEQTRPADFSHAALFRPANLTPWFCAMILLAVTVVPALPAQSRSDSPRNPVGTITQDGASPERLYRGGDVAGARKAWEKAVGANPLDWSSRANLGLALLQQGEAGAAVSQLAIAWVQQPRNPDVKRAFHLALARADAAPAVLGPLQRPGPLNFLTRLASPGEWQWLAVGGSLLGACGMVFLLNAAFHGCRRRSLVAAAVCFGAALLLAAASVTALHTYGQAADRRAVLVWTNSQLRSIPTEVDSSQETTALPAGTLAIVDRPFLGWLKLEFPSGQTGWVRKDDVMPLWH